MQHRCDEISLDPLPQRHLPHRLIYDLFDSQDRVQVVERPVVLRLFDLVDMLEELEALPQTEIPVEL